MSSRSLLLAAAIPFLGLACATMPPAAPPPPQTPSSAPPDAAAAAVTKAAADMKAAAPAPVEASAATAAPVARSAAARARRRAPAPEPAQEHPAPAPIAAPAPTPVAAAAPPPVEAAPAATASRKPLRMSLGVALAVASLLLLFWVRSLGQQIDPVELLGNVGLERVLSAAAAALALVAFVLGATAVFTPEHRLSGASLLLASSSLLWLALGAFSAIGDAQYRADALVHKTESKKFEQAEAAERFRVKEWEGQDWSGNPLVGDLTPMVMLAGAAAILGIIGAVLLA